MEMFYLKRIIPAILFMLLLSCDDDFEHLKWEIQIEQKEDDFILENTFYSKSDTIFLFDNKTFVIECYEEDWKIIEEANYKIEIIQQIISDSQVLIENKNGEMRFASEFVYLDTTRMRSFHLSDCVFENMDTVRIDKGSLYNTEIFVSDIEGMQVTKNDRRNRLHYLFKPDSIQRTMGFDEFRVTSDWFDVPRIY